VIRTPYSENNMIASSVSQATQALTISSAGSREDGSYQMAPTRRLRSLIPWRSSTKFEPDLRHRIALIEEQVAELKIAIDDLRAERDAWQAMAQARIRPASSRKGPLVMGALNRMRR
jgi:hypothetical protein